MRAAVRLLVFTSLLVGACAPAMTPSPSVSQPVAGASGAQTTVAPAPSKSLVVATTVEAPGFGPMFAGGTAGPEHLEAMLHRPLAQIDEKGDYLPMLAAALPSQDDGTWRVFPDGRMETTWTFKPNVRWHDGTPVSVDDVVFGWQVALAPDVPFKQRSTARQIDGITALDGDRFVIAWKSFFIGAATLGVDDLFLLPRHRLEETFLNDRVGFVNSSYWNTDFMGLGPYRLVHWEPGAFAQLEAFDGFFGGPQRIKNITFRFVRDTNTAMANILAGEIDVMLGRSLGLEHAQTLKEQWENRGAGQVLTYPRGVFEIRFAPGDARVADTRVRKALYHAMDRDSIVRDLYFGLLEQAHSYVSYRTNGFDRIDARTTKYPYDPNRAAALMGELGWRRASDGLMHNDRAETFAFPFATTAGNEERIALQTVIGNMWRLNGFDVELQRVPLAIQSDESYLFPTTDLSGVSAAFESNIPRIHGRNLKSPQNPRGQNVWGYDNAEVNDLLEQWLRTPDRNRQIDIEASVVYRLTEDLPILPIKYRIEVITVGKGVTGVPIRSESPGNNSAWNVETWDRS